MSHHFLQEIIHPGDLVIDLTAGRGRDTLVLAEAVGPKGRVVAFDIQPQALAQSKEYLAENHMVSQELPIGEVLPKDPGVYLVKDCHSAFSQIVTEPVKACIANLGYLPGGDETIITQSHTTCSAIEQVLEKLLPGGRLAIVIYPGHRGGKQEAQIVDEFLTNLSHECWRVLRTDVANRPDAPYLMVAERTT